MSDAANLSCSSCAGAGGLESSQAMPNARGGSRRQPVPLVEAGALQQGFEELVRMMGGRCSSSASTGPSRALKLRTPTA